jgi:hypothetical protein
MRWQRAGFPGLGEMIAGRLEMRRAARMPWDRVLGPGCAGAVAVIVVSMAVAAFRRGRAGGGGA